MQLDFKIILLAILVLSWLIQLFYYLWFILRAANHKPIAQQTELHPISVVICAKNEAHNLEQHLPKIFNQDYPEFQVVVVNDCSSDETDMVLAKIKNEEPKLYYTSIPVDKKFYQGKKLALTLGIKAAKHEHLVFTDADCYPDSDQWLKEISNQFSDNKEIIIGHGRFEKKKSLFNLFLRYETFFNAAQYFGFALRKTPFMAVGRNMAYKKSLFLKSDVFKRYLNVASGDDDLFIRECATKTNTAVVVTKQSQTISIAPRNFSEWLNRKSRHLTTSKHYSLKAKWWLLLEPLTRQIFWILSLCLLFFHIFAAISLVLLLTKIIVQYIVLAKAAKTMGEEKLYLPTLLFDPIIPIIIGSVWLQNIFSAKKKKWK